MAQDILVMPIWKFKIGDVETAAQRWARENAVPMTRLGQNPNPVGFLQRTVATYKAKQRVTRIARLVSQANARPVRWRDEGNCVYSEQAFYAETLRTYARWLHYRDTFPVFDLRQLPEDAKGDMMKHPVWKTADRPGLSRCHLATHNCYCGYFLPVDFPRVVPVENIMMLGHDLGRLYGSYWDAGSTQQLVRDLDAIAAVGGVGNRKEDCESMDSNDVMSTVAYGYWELRHITTLSLKHGLPIIFWH